MNPFFVAYKNSISYNENAMKRRNSSRVRLILWPILYMASIISTCLVFAFKSKDFFYDFVYVSGHSMYPLLNNNDNRSKEYQTSDYIDYGRVDRSDFAIENMRRFDLVTCYYPWANEDYDEYSFSYKRHQELKSTATSKVKRLIAFPGERIIIDNSVAFKETMTIIGKNNAYTYFFNDDNLPFVRNREGDNPYRGGDCIDVTLGDESYFVMGDNWAKRDGNTSDDCFNHIEWWGEPGTKLTSGIFRENLDGVIVSFDGFCKRYYYICPECHAKYLNNQICIECGSHLVSEEGVTDLHKVGIYMR